LTYLCRKIKPIDVIHATRGIVLNHSKYAESSIIVTVYTELFGRQSYIINGVRSAHNKGKAVFLQPLALLDMQVYHNPKKEIQRIKEFKIVVPFVSIPFEQTKRSIAFFVTEVMSKSFREEVANAEMFNFVYQQIVEFDASTSAYHEFHLFFLARLTRYLGFFPDFEIDNDDAYFDLLHGMMVSGLPLQHHLPAELLNEWKLLFLSDHQELGNLSGHIRNQLIEYLLQYYRIHLEGFGTIKSLDVLTMLYR
jgi:DNA repair protein RecO (recombination protein O)